jgi:hypothetical protein
MHTCIVHIQHTCSKHVLASCGDHNTCTVHVYTYAVQHEVFDLDLALGLEATLN